MPEIATAFAALAVVLTVTGEARAHKLKLWVHAAEGATVKGQAYFSPGGGAAQGISVKALGPEGASLGRVETDEAGEFVFEARHRCDHTFVVETPDGHRAEATLEAASLPTDLPPLPEGLRKRSPRSVSVPTAPGPPAAPPAEEEAAHPAADDPEVARLVDAAVARHVEPLRREIREYEDRVRVHEVLGGIGYIVGLAGLALYFKSHRRRSADAR
jgi:nickel transport protein